MTVELEPDTRPQLTVTPEVFRANAEDGRYGDVPLEFFSVEYGHVYLDAAVATEIDWNIDAEGSDDVNINAVTQTVRIDGCEISLQPGVFCSYVDKDDIVGL